MFLGVKDQNNWTKRLDPAKHGDAKMEEVKSANGKGTGIVFSSLILQLKNYCVFNMIKCIVRPFSLVKSCSKDAA